MLDEHHERNQESCNILEDVLRNKKISLSALLKQMNMFTSKGKLWGIKTYWWKKMPFTGGELAKECMISGVEIICPEKKNKTYLMSVCLHVQ